MFEEIAYQINIDTSLVEKSIMIYLNAKIGYMDTISDYEHLIIFQCFEVALTSVDTKTIVPKHIDVDLFHGT